MNTITPIHIAVCDSDGVIVQRADPSRARRLSLAPNATVVRKRVSGTNRKLRQPGEIVRILMGSYGDDELLEPANRGNCRVYSHDHETQDNPEKVWTLKRIPTSTRDIFRAVTLDLAA